jgi:hypothetical protein
MKVFHVVLFVVLLCFVFNVDGQSLPSFNVNASSISAIGLSSGAAMAIQFHVSHSSFITGMASLAGPPYYCAQADISIALSSCETDYDLISVTELIAATEYAYSLDSIDSTSYLKQAKVWLYTGTQDTVVVSGVVEKSLAYYQHYVPQDQISFINNYPSEHAWITGEPNPYGNPCSYLGSPYINNCQFDSSGALLQFLYEDLNPSVNFSQSNVSLLFLPSFSLCFLLLFPVFLLLTPCKQQIITFSQQDYVPLKAPPSTISMDEKGFVYVATACMDLNTRKSFFPSLLLLHSLFSFLTHIPFLVSNTECSLEVVVHGCEQSFEQVGDQFYLNAGMNQWAEANNVRQLSLFPSHYYLIHPLHT